MIWGKEMISEADVILLGVNLKTFGLSIELFPQVCQSNIQSVQRKALRDLLMGKYFKSNSHSLRNMRWAFQNWILLVERFILRKIVYYFGNPKLCHSISALEQKQICHISKRHRKAPLKTTLNCPVQSFAEKSGQKVLRFLSEK